LCRPTPIEICILSLYITVLYIPYNIKIEKLQAEQLKKTGLIVISDIKKQKTKKISGTKNLFKKTQKSQPLKGAI